MYELHCEGAVGLKLAFYKPPWIFFFFLMKNDILHIHLIDKTTMDHHHGEKHQRNQMSIAALLNQGFRSQQDGRWDGCCVSFL